MYTELTGLRALTTAWRRLMNGWWLLLLLCSVFPAKLLHAQTRDLRFKHLGIADGLSQSTVYALFQDRKSFIWIGTTDGLSRYDGYSFRHFKYDQQNKHSVGSNELQALGEDAEGNLLVGTSVGLDLFDHRKEMFYPIPVKGDESATRYVKCIYTDSRGIIWVGTSRGLATYDSKQRKLIPINVGNRDKGTLYAIAEDHEHNMWFADGRNVIKYDAVNKQMLPLPNSLLGNPLYLKSAIRVIAIDALHNIWLGTERDGVIFLDQQKGTSYNINAATRPNPISNDMVRAIGFHDGHAWIGTRNGMYVVNNNLQVQHHYQVNRYDRSSLSGNSVLCFMKDNAGSMWIGTFAGGISVEQPGNNNFSYIGERDNDKPGLNYPVVSRILEDKQHNLWIATEGGGVNVYNPTTGQFKYIHLNPSSEHLVNQETIKAIQFDDKDNLWIGTLEGLFYYEPASGRIQQHKLQQGSSMYDEMIYGLAYYNGELWIGTKGGLFKRDANGALTTFRHNAKDAGSIISNDINALMRDHIGGIWIGTESGLSYLPPQQNRFTNYLAEYENVFNKNAILCMYEDRHGNYWTGTRGGGLKVFNKQQNKFYTLDTAYGLADNIVHAIIEDNQGNLWVSFNQAIAKIVLHKTTPPFSKSDVQVTNYSVNNGLGTNEFQTGVCKTASGQIIFGGMNGIVAFQPEQMVLNKVPPPVVLTDLLIKNIPAVIGADHSPLQQSVTYTNALTLTYDQAYFTIRFAALNYINPRTNQYAYMLQGLNDDKQWHYVGNQQTATYTNLPAGNYVFKVKAANNDGLWNEHFTELHIKVLPPIWKTWYAYLLYTLVVGGLLYFFYFYSVKTAKLKNQLALQELNRQKDEELVQRKLSFFTNISHEIKTPLTLVLAPIEKLLAMMQGKEKESEQLKMMQRNGEKLLRLTDQLLDFRKFEAGNMPLQVAQGNVVEFIKEVLLSFEGFARHQQVTLALEVKEQVGEVWFDADKMEKILFNLLSNAFKFTPAGGTITVKVNSTINNTTIDVSDTGSGIAAEHLETIFNPFQHYNDTGKLVAGTGIGLAFTKGLVTLHHGAIRVESRKAVPGMAGYTCFTVTLPANKEAFTEEEFKQEDTPVPTINTVAIPAEAIAPAASEDGSLPLLLIVEDNDEVRAMLADHFAAAFTVHTAATGNEGWQMATDLLPDIVISDVMLPGMHGTELCRQLKKDSRTSHIPLILLTARTQLNYQIEGFETGADEYITKPFSFSLLQVRVNNLLQSRRMLRERYSKDVTLQPSGLAITPADEVFIDKVMRFIEDNIMEPTLQVEEMGKVVNMSRTTLYRKIKGLTGQSVIEFIRGVRLKRAAQFLARNEYTVNEVAYMVGFSDVDYFRKCFKQEFGKTPKEYAGARE